VATPGGRARAAEQFERAIAVAAARKALLFELRAATSLLRLRGNPVREHVARLVARFDAANDCADARIARALLGGCEGSGPGTAGPGAAAEIIKWAAQGSNLRPAD